MKKNVFVLFLVFVSPVLTACQGQHTGVTIGAGNRGGGIGVYTGLPYYDSPYASAHVAGWGHHTGMGIGLGTRLPSAGNYERGQLTYPQGATVVPGQAGPAGAPPAASQPSFPQTAPNDPGRRAGMTQSAANPPIQADSVPHTQGMPAERRLAPPLVIPPKAQPPM